MGVITVDDEYTSTVPPAKLYKAVAIDGDTVLPEANKAIEGVEIVKGDGGPGSIKKLTFNEDGEASHVLHRVDEVDEANLKYVYSVVGGTAFSESPEMTLTVEIKIGPSPDGGSIIKISSKYHSIGKAMLSDALRKETQAKGDDLFGDIERYISEKC